MSLVPKVDGQCAILGTRGDWGQMTENRGVLAPYIGTFRRTFLRGRMVTSPIRRHFTCCSLCSYANGAGRCHRRAGESMKIRKGRALAGVALAGSLMAIVLPVASPAGAAGLTVRSFTSNYSEMFSSTIASVVKSIPGWKPNAAGTKLAIGAILPDEVTSTRYVEFDAPDLTTAFTDAGLPTAELTSRTPLGLTQRRSPMRRRHRRRGARSC